MLKGDIVSIEGSNSLNSYNTLQFKSQKIHPAKIVTKPIDKVENIVSNTLDTFTPETQDEEKKKSNRNAIRAGSASAVLFGLVLLFNPKVSPKLISKIKTMSAKYKNKAKNSSSWTGKIYRFADSSLSKTAKVLDFSNNINSVKDTYFTKLCSKFSWLKKPHKYITKVFDNIGQKTVLQSYNKASRSVDTLNEVILKYRSKLSPAQQKELDRLLEQTKTYKEYCLKDSVSKRLETQAKAMENLNEEIQSHFQSYQKGFHKDGWQNVFTNGKEKVQHLKKNMHFWAEKYLAPEKAKLETNGLNTVHSIIGDGKSKKGIYNQVVEILSPHMSESERNAMQDLINKTSKRINKAHKTEYIEYFDKKRDLVLGSAPTDIITALFWLSLSGVVITRSDDNKERLSKAITTAFPVISGLGISLAMASKLYSGIKAMGIGFGSSLVLNKIGHYIDKSFITRQPKEQEAKYA